ncbi:MAG TPA: D-alanine--D-alanine ligase [Castellaniella sp.]|uniref:D-alanine--D-alanine ligase n=1 Tax=Castellaniella sp. TaxID=1955812 RepID=UPI002F0C2E99
MTTSFGRVGVLYGGRSAEREVSLMSGTGVCKALRDEGVDAHLFDTGLHSLAELADQGFERVFIALHGRYGEDGTIQGALELLNVPYTGSGPLASSLAMDKIATKRLWLQHGLPTPGFTTLACDADSKGVEAELGLPLIIKPPHEGSTLGVTRVDHAEQLPEALALACRFDEQALAEQFIQGRELTVAILGAGAQAHALPVIEIVAPQGNYDYEHKYVSNDTQYLCPAPLEPGLAQRVQSLSEQAYRALGCEGWGRADLMLDGEDRPWLLEMNTSPGMTGHSLVPMGAKAAGMSYGRLCIEILATARCKVRLSAVA